MDQLDCVVVGAGVIGLAVARALALRGLQPLVLESARAIGTGISARNSEVIHAGIYYPTGSLKARLCVRGRDLLLAYAADHGVPLRRCGKLIVATSAQQVAQLQALEQTALANGVADLEMLNPAQARQLEPELHCVAALHSGGTGIVDSRAFMLALQGDVESAGGLLAFGAPVLGGEVDGRGITLQVGGEQPLELHTRMLVNSAGLGAQALARALQGMPAAQVPPLHLAKGSYFGLAGRSPFGRLIYPVPEVGGLGVHLTLDLGGQARFGPDVEWVEQADYLVDPARSQAFYASIRRYWPGLPDGALQPAYAGVRPKLSGPHTAAADFLIQGPQQHGVAGLVHLFGMESPGLTASLAIAERVAALVTGTDDPPAAG